MLSVPTYPTELVSMGKKRFSKSNVLWFIRSRPYTPIADLRRRFKLAESEVTAITDSIGKIYVGLPEREANMLRQLWLEGKIGLEWTPGVHVRVVEGVYPLGSAEKKPPEAETDAADKADDASGDV